MFLLVVVASAFFIVNLNDLASAGVWKERCIHRTSDVSFDLGSLPAQGAVAHISAPVPSWIRYIACINIMHFFELHAFNPPC